MASELPNYRFFAPPQPLYQITGGSSLRRLGYKGTLTIFMSRLWNVDQSCNVKIADSALENVRIRNSIERVKTRLNFGNISYSFQNRFVFLLSQNMK
jgi:hypothetical protein